MNAYRVADWSEAVVVRNVLGRWLVRIPWDAKANTDRNDWDWGYWDTKREAAAFLRRFRDEAARGTQCAGRPVPERGRVQLPAARQAPLATEEARP